MFENITLQKPEKSGKVYHLQSVIGESRAVTYSAIVDNEVLAIKISQFDSDDEETMNECINGSKIVEQINHMNCVRVKDTFVCQADSDFL